MENSQIARSKENSAKGTTYNYNKGNAKRGVSIDSRVFTRMLQGKN
jgi:hypothetical protein